MHMRDRARAPWVLAPVQFETAQLARVEPAPNSLRHLGKMSPGTSSAGTSGPLLGVAWQLFVVAVY